MASMVLTLSGVELGEILVLEISAWLRGAVIQVAQTTCCLGAGAQ
jgi:hypothetical protein